MLVELIVLANVGAAISDVACAAGSPKSCAAPDHVLLHVNHLELLRTHEDPTMENHTSCEAVEKQMLTAKECEDFCLSGPLDNIDARFQNKPHSKMYPGCVIVIDGPYIGDCRFNPNMAGNPTTEKSQRQASICKKRQDVATAAPTPATTAAPAPALTAEPEPEEPETGPEPEPEPEELEPDDDEEEDDDGDDVVSEFPEPYNKEDWIALDLQTLESPFDLGPVFVQDGVQFCVWAPHANSAEVVPMMGATWQQQEMTIATGRPGVWCATVTGAAAGDKYLYSFSSDLQTQSFYRLDPYSRDLYIVSNNASNAQHTPYYYDGVNLYSVITDTDFAWTDQNFTAVATENAIVYELHIGSFTEEGTFAAAEGRLDYISGLGVTAIQLMPVLLEAYVGHKGYSPKSGLTIQPEYGGFNGLQSFVNAAHSRGLAVILDVVWNHFAPTSSNLGRDPLNIGHHVHPPESGYDGYAGYQGKGIYGSTYSVYGTCLNMSQPMVVKYMLSSVKTLVEEAHVDGFRWDWTGGIYMGLPHINGQPTVASHTCIKPNAIEVPQAYWALQAINIWLDSHGKHLKMIEPACNGDFNTLPANATSEASASLAEFDFNFEGGLGFDRAIEHTFGNNMIQFLTGSLTSALIVANWVAGVSTVDNVVTGRDPKGYLSVDDQGSMTIQGNSGGRVVWQVDQSGSAMNPSRQAAKVGAMSIAVATLACGTPKFFAGTEWLSYQPIMSSPGSLTVGMLDWSPSTANTGITHLFQDFMRLRRDLDGNTSALKWPVPGYVPFHNHDVAVVVRSDSQSTVVMVFNTVQQTLPNYLIQFMPAGGTWTVRLNSDSTTYSPQFGGFGLQQNQVVTSSPCQVRQHGTNIATFCINLDLPDFAVIVLVQGNETRTADAPATAPDSVPAPSPVNGTPAPAPVALIGGPLVPPPVAPAPVAFHQHQPVAH